jgi:hypothetical protein
MKMVIYAMGSQRGKGSPLHYTTTYRQDVTAEVICLSLCLFCGVSDVDKRIKAELIHSMGAALFGYDLGVIAYVLEAPDFLATIGMSTKETYDTNYIGFIVSSLLLG